MPIYIVQMKNKSHEDYSCMIANLIHMARPGREGGAA